MVEAEMTYSFCLDVRIDWAISIVKKVDAGAVLSRQVPAQLENISPIDGIAV